MGNYKNIQETVALRHQNNIKAYRILNIRENHLIFQLWLNSDKLEEIQVLMPEEYQIGGYIDLQVTRASKMSHQVTLIGRTPQKFIPADGRNIVV